MAARRAESRSRRLGGVVLLLLLLLLVWSVYRPLKGAGPVASVPGSFTLLDSALAAAAQRRQCPPVNGSTLSIAFLHTPKTAGTSLVENMREMMPKKVGRWCTRIGKDADLPLVLGQCGREQDGWADPDPGHLQMLDVVKQKFPSRCAGISTHHDITFFDLVGVDFGRSLTMVALRHPVDRLVSEYYYSMEKRPKFMKDLKYAPKHDDDYAGLLKYVREVGRDHQVRQLAGSFGCRWPDGPTTRPEGRAMLEVAKRNLERFCVIVIAELMQESRLRLAAAAGWDASKVISSTTELEGKARSGKVNSNPHPPVPMEVKQSIGRETAMDMELYEYGLQLFMHETMSS